MSTVASPLPSPASPPSQTSPSRAGTLPGPPVISPTIPASNLSTAAFPQSSPSPLFPPDYSSIANPSTSATSQAERNREKQAIRDQQRLGQSPAASPHPVPAPASVEPSEEGSSERRRGESHSSGERANRPDRGLGILGTDFGGRGRSATGAEGILPAGMNVQEALARCEDPTLGWSMQFWVTIADPLTQHVFFACPASGHCSWDPPVGAFVVPRSPDGEWWELADSSRNNRSYYYNTLTGRTQWTRPGGNAFVIPLGLIQRNALPARPNNARQSSNNTSSSYLSPVSAQSPRRDRERTSSTPSSPHTPQRNSGPRTPQHSQTFPPLGALAFPEPHASRHMSIPTYSPSQPSPSNQPSVLGADHSSPVRSPPVIAALRSAPLSVVEEAGSASETERSDGSVVAGWWDKRKTLMPKRFGNGVGGSPKKGKARDMGDTTEEDGEEGREERVGDGIGQGQKIVRQGDDLPTDVPDEPIKVESTMRTKRLSTGLHPLLPPDITNQIQDFHSDDFARKYFVTKRTGLLRQRVPLERLTEWSRSPIAAPLLPLPTKTSQKDALLTFKVIQHVMGERGKPVEGAKPPKTASSALHLHANEVGGAAEDKEGREGKMQVLEEIRWMIGVSVSEKALRDEVFCQVVKQLTKNPDHDAVVLGFQLLCVLVNAFGPSDNFEPFVRAFLGKHTETASDGIGIMAKYCLGKLSKLSRQPARARNLTVGEIEHASDAAFYPSVYGESLERIMQHQQATYPDLKVPVILPFLADGILALGGLDAEGIFRVPGDGDSVSELKSRMDRGHYQLNGIDDPHVAASLFKLWLRELEEPLIPSRLYNDALTASKTPEAAIAFLDELPTFHRRVLLFVISFVQMFTREEVVERTKMTPQNLSLVLAPNVLRTESDSLVTVFTNSGFESKFVLQLLEHLKPGQVDPEYVPTHGVGAGLING